MSSRQPTFVHYAEARSSTALEQLRLFFDALDGQPGFVGAELLTSPEQPGLALVASRWAGPVPALTLPEGVRAWTFEIRRHLQSGR